MKRILICLVLILVLLSLVFLIPEENMIAIKFNGSEVDLKQGVTLKDNVVCITKAGTYVLSGTSNEYKVEVETDGVVTLVLDNLQLEKDNGVLDIKKANNVVIETKGNNKLVSNAGKGILSKAVTNIKGTGMLEIVAYEGIRIDNTFTVDDVTLKISSKSDAIKSRDIILNKANITVNTEGMYYVNNVDGRYALIEDRYVKVAKTDVGMYNTLYSLSYTSKGLNVEGTAVINNSNLDIDSTDDALNVVEMLDLSNTKLNLKTSDDAIASDTKIYIKNSNVSIESCYEGIEAEYIEIKETTMDIKGDDDALNIVSDKYNGKLVVNNSNVNIDVLGDGLDIMGRTDISNTTLNMNTGDNGIQSKELYVTDSKVKVFAYNKATYAFITQTNKLIGEIVLAQNEDKIFLTRDYEITLNNSKTPYVCIKNKSEFKIMDDNNNIIFETGKEHLDCANYIYINSDIDKDVIYYLVTDTTKEILEFNNLK